MNKRTMKKGLAIVLALVMVFAMTATAFASTNGTSTINFYIVDAATGTGELVDSVTAASGQTLYSCILNNLDYYEPSWTQGIDEYDHVSTTYYLDSFMGYASMNVDHMYSTTMTNWSRDWGWVYTVNGAMPAFSDNPQHRKAMNQYTIQNGDSIDVAYTRVYTTWQPNSSDATFTIELPWK